METKEAVRLGVVDYLSSRTGLSVASMQIDVLSVDFRGKEADAVVSFRPKGGGEGMQMNYTLERQGNRWVVKGRAGSSSGNPHGGAAVPDKSGSAGMPAGHPPTSDKAGNAELPAGHPPVPKSAPPESKK
ncbi:MAG: hypothetical protein M1541_09730 [Acidobacteria bacterium]|nr:hypothetical protein [Acidobacteriota bacterium]